MTEIPRRREVRRVRWAWCLATALLLPGTIMTTQAAHARASAPALGHPAHRAGLNALAGWGANAHGQIGNGDTFDQHAPGRVSLPAETKVTGARAAQFSLVVTDTGMLYAWGDNSAGELGNGTTTDSTTPVPVQLPTGVKVTAARAGSKFALALTSTGKVLAWGSNANGMLGNGKKTGSDLPVQVKLPTGTKIKAISTGAFFALALTTKGQVLAWGSNRYGQLGDGTRIARRTPVHVHLPADSRAKLVSAGGAFGLILTTTGRVLAWGHGAHGALGNASTHDSRALVRVRLPTGTQVTSLFGGMSHALALTKAGHVLAWGAGTAGQLGNGATADRHTPVQVHLPSGAKATAITAGQDYSMALMSDGSILAWGANTHGQLGNGTTTSSNTPVSVMLSSTIVALNIGAGPVSQTSLAFIQRRLVP
jgi:alpha-tubulin suppressor-like RCC1 family protein